MVKLAKLLKYLESRYTFYQLEFSRKTEKDSKEPWPFKEDCELKACYLMLELVRKAVRALCVLKLLCLTPLAITGILKPIPEPKKKRQPKPVEEKQETTYQVTKQSE